MSLGQWLAFGSLLFIVLITPGPDFVLILRHSLANRRTGATVAAGVVCGMFVHTAAAALGLSALVAARPGLLTVLTYAGAAYLAWLGFSALRSAFRAHGADASLVPMRERIPTTTAFRYGFLSNLLNPKALLFFLGLLPQFVEPGAGVVGRTVLLASATVLAAALWWTGLVVVAASAGRRLRRPTVSKRIDVVSGVALVGLGAFFGFA
ncbi:threonine/homoserine/homoserine lactone efflux protein [Rhodococcus sp. 27YEA15]|uniref:LysE family translocator n=1 Tax=Rhodococcus sp. 27YEA15 TaxID=3156259 RepID=UPI003C7CD64C